MSKRPKRILHLITTLPVGGAERVLLNTVALLDRLEFESVVCCIMQEGELAAEIRQLGIPVIVLNLVQQKGWDQKVVPALCKLIREQRIDLVHAHLYHANLYGRIAALKSKIPSIITVHNTYATTKWHRRFLNWYLGRRTAAVIAVSEDIKRDIMRWDHLAPKLIKVIPNGIRIARMESNLSKEEARVKLNLDASAKILVSVGRLEEQKGHRFLLMALPLLKNIGLEPICLIVGEGRERERLNQLALELGVSTQVKLLGTRFDVADILRAADLYVMPSLWEGLSLALLEAMAANIPIIATDVGGMRQVLGETLGLMASPKKPESIAELIDYAFGHPVEMHRMSQLAYQNVKLNYSDQRMVKDIAEIYLDVLKRKAPSPSKDHQRSI